MANDQIYLDAWGSLLRVHSEVVNRIERDLQESEALSLTWFDVLLVLHDAPERKLRMSDLANEIVLSKSALSRSVDRLESLGLIKRERSEEDDRVSYAVLLPKGLEKLRASRPTYRAGIRAHFAQHVSPEELESLDAILTKIAFRLR